MSLWYQFKLLIEHASGISMDALHILAGVGLQLSFAGLFRTSLASWRPWLFVFFLLVANEAGDLWVEQWPEPGMQYGESLKDVFVTMVVPSMLMLGARWAPSLFNVGESSSRGDESSD